MKLPSLTRFVKFVCPADREVAAGIQWSEYLDLLFVNNYESDSSLSWQYYGATSGFLRRFPGTNVSPHARPLLFVPFPFPFPSEAFFKICFFTRT